MNIPPCWIDVKCQCGACFTARIASDWGLSVEINHTVGLCCEHPAEWVYAIYPDSVFGEVSTGFVQCPTCSRRTAISLQGAPEPEKPEPISFDATKYARLPRLPNFKEHINQAFVSREAPKSAPGPGPPPKARKLPRRRIYVPQEAPDSREDA